MKYCICIKVASYPALPAFFRLQEEKAVPRFYCKRKKLGRLGSRLVLRYVCNLRNLGFLCVLCRKAPLPTLFLKSRKGQGPLKKVLTYDRDICCLPRSFLRKDGTVAIPRSTEKRTYLCAHGLVGKIRLTSDMAEEEIMDEIRSVFKRPFGYDTAFPFDILQPGGGSMKSLVIPSLSSSYAWTASSVAGSTKSKIYILAHRDIEVSLYRLWC